MLEPPQSRTTFTDDWDELEYCFEHAQYWHYGRSLSNKALPFAQRVEELVKAIPGALDAIIPHECLAVAGECQNDWSQAIKHRLKEIELIERLWRAAGQKRGQEKMDMLQGYDAEELADRHERLAYAYVQNEQFPEAMKALAEAEEICFAHHIDFDADDIRTLMFKKLHQPD